MEGMERGSMMLPEGTAPGELPAPDSRGTRLAVRFCSGCHGVPSPGRHGASEWPGILDRMFRRMDRVDRMSGMRERMMGRGGGMERDVPVPSGEERRTLRAYYREHALEEAEEDRLPDLPGRDVFRTACSRCHALPDPTSRPAEAWPEIVRRMRGHMQRAENVAEHSNTEAAAVVEYLRRAARRARQGPDDGAR